MDGLLSNVDREVWVVTAAWQGRRSGLVANFVMQASIDPEMPRLLVGMAPNHFTCELAEGAGRLAVHLLREDQLELVWRFGLSSGRDQDKFAGLALGHDSDDLPMLDDCLASAKCKVVERFVAPGRTFFLCDLVAERQITASKPLRERAVFEKASPEQRRMLAANMQADIQIARASRCE